MKRITLRAARRKTLVVALALALTAAITSAVFWLAGASPIDAYGALYKGSLGSRFGFEETLMLTGVLILVALAAAVPARAQLWNIGGEGQMFVGALGAVLVGLNLQAPPPLVVIAALSAGAAAGALWGAIAGTLKSTLAANEVLTTLMLNFVAILLVDLAITRVFADSGVPSASPHLPIGVELPELWPGAGINLTIVVAVTAAFVAHVLLMRTSLGLRIRAVGLGIDAARNAGLPVARLQALSLALGGAFAGLAGAVIVVGIQGLLVRGFSPGFGFVGIAIAMLARAKPAWVVPSAVLFAALTVGGSYLEPIVGLSASAAILVQAVLVISLLAFWVFPPGRIGGK